MKLKKILKKIFLPKTFEDKLIETKQNLEGSIMLFDKSFKYHFGLAFYVTYNEIFTDGIYEFETQNPTPKIIDCGANMGLSLLYFAKKYPNATILAFEPDQSVLPILEENIKTQDLKNVKLFKKAVWTSETELQFFTDNGMGGRIDNAYENQTPTLIKTVKLSEYLNKKIDFLKIDIEGAEYEVLKDCEQNLKNVDKIFVEYHSEEKKEQHLDEILSILKRAGFRYHLRESFSRKKPFVEKTIICERFDMAINIFAYKN